MMTWQKIMFATIICITWGMLSFALLSIAHPKDMNIIIGICTLSCSVTIKFCLWLELFTKYPDAVAVPIAYAIQFVVYSIIAFSIAIVIYKNDKTIRKNDNSTEPTQD